MTDEIDQVPAHERPLLYDRQADSAAWALWIGSILAVIGLVDGVIMALRRHVATCPDGTEFPQGATDFNCYVHPQAGEGVAVAVVSLMLGILIFLLAMALDGLRTRQPVEPKPKP